MFVSLYLAQMGDKTQLLTLFLATKTKKHWILFWGVMTGFAIGVGLAVLFGAGLSHLIPHKFQHGISAIIFFVMGIIFLRDGVKKKQKYKNINLKHTYLTTAFLIFVTDFGDKTQIALTIFAVNNHPLLVFLAGILALGVDTVLMIIFSKLILRKINEHIIERIAGLLFIATGVFLLLNL